MPRWPRTTVRRDANRHSRKGEVSLLLRSSINVIGGRKPRPIKDQHVGKTNVLLGFGRWTNEVEAEEVDSTYPTKGTQNFGYKKEAMEKPSQEGGASTLA